MWILELTTCENVRAALLPMSSTAQLDRPSPRGVMIQLKHRSPDEDPQVHHKHIARRDSAERQTVANMNGERDWPAWQTLQGHNYVWNISKGRLARDASPGNQISTSPALLLAKVSLLRFQMDHQFAISGKMVSPLPESEHRRPWNGSSVSDKAPVALPPHSPVVQHQPSWPHAFSPEGVFGRPRRSEVVV